MVYVILFKKEAHMARKRRISKKCRSRRIALLLSVLALLLVVAAVYRFFYLPLREERIAAEEAAQAGAQHHSTDIPRNPYLHDGFSLVDGRVAYEDDIYFALTGIDVSSHQGEIDWAAVAADGIDYAVIQAGYRGYEDGALNEDIMFRSNLTQAQQQSIPCGVYFFSQAVSVVEAEEEAAYLLALLGDAKLELPVFYDWETVGVEDGRANAVDGATVTACAKAFCAAVEAGGYEAGVYFNQNQIYTEIELTQLLDYPLWMAQYQTEPDCIYAFTWWQYTDSGSVAGIETPVDLNVWFREKSTS